jgi:hypothetical protein
MSTSELIKILEELKSKHGDLPVYYECQKIDVDYIGFIPANPYFNLPGRIELAR